MTTIPPPSAAPPQIPAAAAAAPVIAIPAPPPALAAAASGTVVEAVVLPPPAPAPPPPGPQTAPPQTATLPASTPQTVTLHTAVGDLTVRLPVPLPDGARIDLEIVRAAPQQVSARLTAIDGVPASQYLAQTRTPAAAAPAPAATPDLAAQMRPPAAGPQPLSPGLAWTPAGPAPLAQLGTLSAVVTLAPPAAAAPPPAAAPGAPAPQPGGVTAFASLPIGTGSELSLRIVGVQLPAAPFPAGPAGAAPAIAPAIATPNGAALQPPPQAASSAAGPAPSLIQPPAATTAATPSLVLSGPQGLPAPQPSPPVAVQTPLPLAAATGIVIGLADSIPVVAVEGKQVQLNVRANLPVGTKIMFDVTAALPPRAGAPPPLPLPAAAPPLSGPAGAYTGWPTLTEALGVLQRTDPAAAQQLAQAVPDGGARTAAAAISFVQALRTGDPRQWPGDATLRALERAGPRGAHLAGHLSAEVSELASRARETSTDWRALPIPWNAEGRIERVTLITRREDDGEADGQSGSKGGGTRFLVDLDLSRLGPMQLDGMFRKEQRAFDLVMRTRAPLPDDMRRDLMGLFADVNAAMGLTGGITFQVTRKFAAPLAAGNSPDKSGVWA